MDGELCKLYKLPGSWFVDLAVWSVWFSHTPRREGAIVQGSETQ